MACRRRPPRVKALGATRSPSIAFDIVSGIIHDPIPAPRKRYDIQSMRAFAEQLGLDAIPRLRQGARQGAKVEQVFRVLKCQFGYCKVRYRGIAKNGAQVFALLALANLYHARLSA
jgi:IS5 family transposase